ncbi:inhibitor of nuclear factor kappa-B kinase subunit alpha-like [Diadema setosum]|uniref:inhibitor of nuclear factor kappa-B kinase subunit alpha-like n=1 Tax=Diadema setosum TaxID=31175 RepID=UPI003B3A6B5B
MPTEWVPRKTLGSGSFGDVMLYEHKTSKQCIAIKKCKVELDSRMEQRWRDEVDFMQNLCHAHIVQGVQVPAELESQSSRLPCLGMEFCSKGDLRRKLAEFSHVCGLPEPEIILLARHISSAIEYLHDKSIIHRDIKPENIMIQDTNGKNTYKLTDLGFAKDNKIQAATSFVGTKEYMAPELYSQVEYTKTVDFWSFGTVISEVITGSRPFVLSDTPLVQWHSIIGKKQAKDIGYYEDPKGAKSYFQQLPIPNQLCRPRREGFEHWLGLMLRTDPKSRGGIEKQGRHLCFMWLDDILNCKVINVWSMMDTRVLSYPTKPNDTVFHLYKTLSREVAIPYDQICLMLPNGTRLTDGSAILHSYFKEEQGDGTLYMYQPHLPSVEPPLTIKQKSDLLKALLQDSHSKVSENGFKLMWKHGLHYCHSLMNDGKTRLDGFISFLNYNLLLKTSLKKCVEDVKAHGQKLKGKVEAFNESLATDRKCYAMQAATGIHSQEMFAGWTKSQEEVKNISEICVTKCTEFETEMTNIGTKVFELHKSCNKLKNYDSLNQTISSSNDVFKRFKEENTVKRREHIDCQPIQEQVQRAEAQYVELMTNIFAKLREVQKSSETMEELMGKMREWQETARDVEEKISQRRKERQNNVWQLLGAAVLAKVESDRQLKRTLSRPRSLEGPLDSGGQAAQYSPQTSDDGQKNQLAEESIQMQSHFDLSFNTLREDQLESIRLLEELDLSHLEEDLNS